MAGNKEHMAKMRAARKNPKQGAIGAPRRESYVDEMRRRMLPVQEGETPLMYARRKAGWPPLRSK